MKNSSVRQLQNGNVGETAAPSWNKTNDDLYFVLYLWGIYFYQIALEANFKTL